MGLERRSDARVGVEHIKFLWEDFAADGSRTEKQFARTMCCVNMLLWPRMTEIDDGLTFAKVPGEGAISQSGACWPGTDGHGTANKRYLNCYNEADCRAKCLSVQTCMGYTYDFVNAGEGVFTCELHSTVPTWTMLAGDQTVCYAKVNPETVFTAPPPASRPLTTTIASVPKAHSTAIKSTVEAITAGDDAVGHRPTLVADEKHGKAHSDKGRSSSTTIVVACLGLAAVFVIGIAVRLLSVYKQREMNRLNQLDSSAKLLAHDNPEGNSESML